MTDPFQNLKNSMKKTVFKELTFSNERKIAVKEHIQGKHRPNSLIRQEETMILILEALANEAKQGFDIISHLFQRNNSTFFKNEGQLYTLLHLLENKGILSSEWQEAKKYYSLSAKGKKQLIAYKESSTKQRPLLRHLLEEASL